jgi:hypothetical protein
LRILVPRRDGNGPVIPTSRQLAKLGFDDSLLRDYDSLRRMRNLLVHGVELPALEDFEEAARRLDEILATIKARMTSTS